MEDSLKLKRLLVTMKQQYEKSLHQAQLQLQAELDEKSSLQEEKDHLENKLKEIQSDHDNELKSLKNQQIALKELLKKSQTDNQSLKDELLRKTQELSSLTQSSVLKEREVVPFLSKETEKLQDKYELLKEEWKQLNDQFEETLELKFRAEAKLDELNNLLSIKENQCNEWEEQCHQYKQQCEGLENEKQKIQSFFEESENSLRTAQQHLAKKVKENTLQNEHIEELQNQIVEFIQTLESQKVQISQLQASVELYQKQEARLHEQLHEALRGTDSKIVKWEDKYFQLQEKWQQCESMITQLKRTEEKYHQLRRFLNTLQPYLEEVSPLSSISENFHIATEDFISASSQDSHVNSMTGQEEKNKGSIPNLSSGL